MKYSAPKKFGHFNLQSTQSGSAVLERLILLNSCGRKRVLFLEKSRIMKKKTTSAFTLIEILIVVAILALIAAIGVPSIQGAFSRAQDRVKETNVSTIEAAKEQWALLQNLPDGIAVTWENIEPFMAHGVDSLDELNVNDEMITIGNIGTKASY